MLDSERIVLLDALVIASPSTDEETMGS